MFSLLRNRLSYIQDHEIVNLLNVILTCEFLVLISKRTLSPSWTNWTRQIQWNSRYHCKNKIDNPGKTLQIRLGLEFKQCTYRKRSEMPLKISSGSCCKFSLLPKYLRKERTQAKDEGQHNYPRLIFYFYQPITRVEKTINGQIMSRNKHTWLSLTAWNCRRVTSHISFSLIG